MPVKVTGFDDWSRAAARTDTDAISVRGSRLPELTLFGEALGSGHLRIVEASTGLLYDRVDIRSAYVADAEIFVSDFSDRDAFGLTVGESVLVFAVLSDSEGNSVADSSQRITAEQNGTIELIGSRGSVTPITDAPVVIRLTAGSDFSKEIRRDVFVPDGITTYVPPVTLSPPLDLEAGLEVDASGDICFRLMNGQLPLAGGKMTFTVSSNLFLGSGWTCVYVYGDEPGPAYIEATYGSLVTRVEFNVFE